MARSSFQHPICWQCKGHTSTGRQMPTYPRTLLLPPTRSIIIISGAPTTVYECYCSNYMWCIRKHTANNIIFTQKYENALLLLSHPVEKEDWRNAWAFLAGFSAFCCRRNWHHVNLWTSSHSLHLFYFRGTFPEMSTFSFSELWLCRPSFFFVVLIHRVYHDKILLSSSWEHNT